MGIFDDLIRKPVDDLKDAAQDAVRDRIRPATRDPLRSIGIGKDRDDVETEQRNQGRERSDAPAISNRPVPEQFRGTFEQGTSRVEIGERTARLYGTGEQRDVEAKVVGVTVAPDDRSVSITVLPRARSGGDLRADTLVFRRSDDGESLRVAGVLGDGTEITQPGEWRRVGPPPAGRTENRTTTEPPVRPTVPEDGNAVARQKPANETAPAEKPAAPSQAPEKPAPEKPAPEKPAAERPAAEKPADAGPARSQRPVPTQMQGVFVTGGGDAVFGQAQMEIGPESVRVVGFGEPKSNQVRTFDVRAVAVEKDDQVNLRVAEPGTNRQYDVMVIKGESGAMNVFRFDPSASSEQERVTSSVWNPAFRADAAPKPAAPERRETPAPPATPGETATSEKPATTPPRKESQPPKEAPPETQEKPTPQGRPAAQGTTAPRESVPQETVPRDTGVTPATTPSRTPDAGEVPFDEPSMEPPVRAPATGQQREIDFSSPSAETRGPAGPPAAATSSDRASPAPESSLASDLESHVRERLDAHFTGEERQRAQQTFESRREELRNQGDTSEIATLKSLAYLTVYPNPPSR